MRVGRLEDGDQEAGEDGSGRPPKYLAELKKRWLPVTQGSPARFDVGSAEFCALCTYVLELKNAFSGAEAGEARRGDARLRVVVS